MCTSFRLDVKESAELQVLIDELLRRHALEPGYEQRTLFDCDLHPDDEVLTIAREGEVSGAQLMRWGLPGFSGRKPIVNARRETIAIKPLFSAALESRRCLVPATGFYEWDSSRMRHVFTAVDGSPLYFAGVFSRYDGVPRCCILTTAADEDVAPIHDRMPLIIPAEQRNLWLRDPQAYRGLLTVEQPCLQHRPSPNDRYQVIPSQAGLF